MATCLADELEAGVKAANAVLEEFCVHLVRDSQDRHSATLSNLSSWVEKARNALAHATASQPDQSQPPATVNLQFKVLSATLFSNVDEDAVFMVAEFPDGKTANVTVAFEDVGKGKKFCEANLPGLNVTAHEDFWGL